MQTEQHLQRVIQIAYEAHDGQMDKSGNPCVSHCKRVTSLVVSDDERVVVCLHDVPEKASAWMIDRLREESFQPS